MKHFTYTLLFSILTTLCLAQVVIPASTLMAVQDGTEISIATTSSITSNAFDFAGAKLSVELSGSTQSITGNIILENLSLTNNGVKSLNGNITITNNLSFQKGILTPTALGKILFTGLEDGITDASNDSFYNGIFYSKGTGRRLFPVGIVGSPNIYTPLGFSTVSAGDLEIAASVINGSALLTPDTTELNSVNNDHYWKIEGDPFVIDSRVGLGLGGLEAYLNTTKGAATVVQANAVGDEAKNLGSNSSTDILVSFKKISSSIFAVGLEKKFDVKVNDLITPYTLDNSNDKLYIQNLNRFEHNKVTLLDRYGTRIHQWIDYTNDDVAYDFSTLSPGNYICIVEYGNTGKSKEAIQQMVTVLKTN